MSKNIKAYFDDKNEAITLETDAKAGDQIQLSELTAFDKYIDKEINIKYKVKIINEFKESEEYKKYQAELNQKIEIINNLQLNEKELQNKINLLENDKELIIKQTIEDFKNSNDYQELLKTNAKNIEENIKLKEQLNASKKIISTEAIEEFKKSDEFLSKLNLIEKINKEKNALESKITNFNSEMKILELKKEDELNKKINEFNLKIQDKENEIKNLEKEIENINKRKREMNIKQLGENLEQECLKMYNDSLGQFIDDSIFKKAELIDDTKADFVFEVYAENLSINSKNKPPLLGKVILEMKTEQDNSEHKKTNKSHLPKLEKDRINSKAEIALLITELEREDYFYIKRDPEYKNIIIARPEAMISLLTIIRIILLKNKDLALSGIEFKEKQKILEEFNEFKNSILNITIERINNNLNDIIKKAESISKNANDILSSSKIILETHINTLKNKIEGFKIENKVTNKIDQK